MSPYDRNNSTTGIWAFLVTAFIIISYVFPNVPRQVFRVAVGGIENIVIGFFDATKDELTEDEPAAEMSEAESTEDPAVVESIYPEVVDTIFGECSYDLMNHYPSNLSLVVSRLNGVLVMTDTSMLATRMEKLPQGTRITPTGTGVCMNGEGWWPVSWVAEGKILSGWTMGGRMTQDHTEKFFFAKQ